MDRHDEIIPREQIDAWIRSNEFRHQVLPRLVARARRIHAGQGRYKRAALRDRAVEVEDLVQEALGRLLSGRRRCKVNEDLETVLYGIMESMASHGDERAAKLGAEQHEDHHQYDDPHQCMAAPRSPTDKLINAKLSVARIEKAIAGDRGVEQLYEAITVKEALTPKEQGEALGWEPNVVRTTWERFRRRAVAALKPKKDEEDDGPQGDRTPGEAPPTGGRRS
jgi:DNA-directed RNA polymerase specialized sigma24 family protein